MTKHKSNKIGEEPEPKLELDVEREKEPHKLAEVLANTQTHFLTERSNSGFSRNQVFNRLGSKAGSIPDSLELRLAVVSKPLRNLQPGNSQNKGTNNQTNAPNYSHKIFISVVPRNPPNDGVENDVGETPVDECIIHSVLNGHKSSVIAAGDLLV